MILENGWNDMDNINIKHFNIRVYGILINDQEEVLLTDEFRLGQRMTKFPGGGLEFGEGPIDCIKREALEEFGQPVEVTGHFYTTGFFQKALFYEDHQLISIYYRIRLLAPPTFGISKKAFDFEVETEGAQSFRWKPVAQLSTDDVSFPVDKKVVQLLHEIKT
jgi:8-oxo-dGTP pyrophosphatase MutT (NUDIX family)